MDELSAELPNEHYEKLRKTAEELIALLGYGLADGDDLIAQLDQLEAIIERGKEK